MPDFALYIEIDPYPAAWLRNLIAAGHIANGIVDERSIEDITPDELRGFRQVHLFAGIGVWSYALRSAGWADDDEIWSASCPCQPFSAAGQGNGFDDKRHLWPHTHHLVAERRPRRIVGEQVASKDAEPWLDLVHADLEALDYAVGALAFPSASVGAPHIRDRTYWCGVADADSSTGGQRRADVRGRAHADHERFNGQHPLLQREESGRIKRHSMEIAGGGESSGLADANSQPAGRDGRSPHPAEDKIHGAGPSNDYRPAHDGGTGRPGPTNGYWAAADWLGCRDGKWRPVEPGTFPLAHGAAARVGRLRAYGNAINAQAARAFLEILKECAP